MELYEDLTMRGLASGLMNWVTDRMMMVTKQLCQHSHSLCDKNNDDNITVVQVALDISRFGFQQRISIKQKN